VVAFGNHSDQAIRFHDQQCADVFIVHHLDRLEDCCVRRYRKDFAAFLIQDRFDGATHVHKRRFHDRLTWACHAKQFWGAATRAAFRRQLSRPLSVGSKERTARSWSIQSTFAKNASSTRRAQRGSRFPDSFPELVSTIRLHIPHDSTVANELAKRGELEIVFIN